MPAIDISNSPPSGTRTPLAQKLPLSTPYVLQIFPVYACNFRCHYCVLSLPRQQRTNTIANKKFLDFHLYKKCIDDLQDFPEKLKVVRFCGVGEPTLHGDLAKMIAYANDSGKTESTELLTNGALLSKKMSSDLVNAGLKKIRISIQGTNTKTYREVTQNFEDIQQVIDNISYLYSIRKNCSIYVKIIDLAIQSEEDKQKFFQLFENICDFIAIERLFPSSPLINYGNVSMNTTQNGTPIIETDICSQPFFLLQLHPDGQIEPCCGMESPPFVGNIAEESLASIWNGEALRKFRLTQLDGEAQHPSCEKCGLYRYNTFPEDALDHDRDRLSKIYRKCT